MAKRAVAYEKRFYRPDEVATILEEPIRNVYLWIQQGHIAKVDFGRKFKVPKAEVIRVLKEGVCPRS